MYILSVKEVCQWFLFQLSYINITFFTNSDRIFMTLVSQVLLEEQ